MPDPQPSMAALSFSSTITASSSRSSLVASTSGSTSNTSFLSTAEETPVRSSLWRGGSLPKLQVPRGNFNLKNDMDVFSPVADVQPITPSPGSLWDDHVEEKRDFVFLDKKSLPFPNITGILSFTDGDSDPHQISEWRSSTASKQDDTLASQLTTTSAFSKTEYPFSPTLPDSWGGNNLQPSSMLSHQLPSLLLASDSTFTGVQSFSSTSQIAKPSSNVTKFSKLAKLSDGANSVITSPKSKKTGAETREELLNNLLLRQDTSSAAGNGNLQFINGVAAQHPRASTQAEDQLGSTSFSLQLVQRTLEETLGSLQKSIHDDVKNLYIDLPRQFHMQEMLTSNLLNTVLEKLDELTKEVQILRRENQQLRQLL